MIWFSSIFVYLNPFQQWLYDFEIHFFTQRTTEGLICNYYRRLKCSLMMQKEKTCIKNLSHTHLNTIHCESHSFFTSNCDTRHSHKERISRTSSDIQINADEKESLFVKLTHNRSIETKRNVTEVTKKQKYQSKAKLLVHSVMRYLQQVCQTSPWSPPTSQRRAEARNIRAVAARSSGPSLNRCSPFLHVSYSRQAIWPW